MRAYYLNSKTDEHGPIEVEPSLNEYHRLIGCDCITVVTREVSGHPFDIVLDDDGLLKPNRVSAISVEADVFGTQEKLVGNLLIFGVDPDNYEHGNRSLTDDELVQIGEHVMYAFGVCPILFYTR